MSEFVGYTFKRDVGVMESMHAPEHSKPSGEESQKIHGVGNEPVDDHELI